MGRPYCWEANHCPKTAVRKLFHYQLVRTEIATSVPNSGGRESFSSAAYGTTMAGTLSWVPIRLAPVPLPRFPEKLTHSLTHSLTRSLTHSVTHSLARSFTHVFLNCTQTTSKNRYLWAAPGVYSTIFDDRKKIRKSHLIFTKSPFDLMLPINHLTC